MSSVCVMRPLWSTSARCQIAVRRSFLITGWSMFSPCTNASRSNRYWCLFIRPSILPPGTAAVKAARADRRFIHQASLTVSTNMSESNVVRPRCSAPRARSNSASESSRRAERSLWKPSSISSSFSASPPLEVVTTERCRGPEPCGTRLFSGPRLPKGIAVVPAPKGPLRSAPCEGAAEGAAQVGALLPSQDSAPCNSRRVKIAGCRAEISSCDWCGAPSTVADPRRYRTSLRPP